MERTTACMKPYFINKRLILVPCGKCPNCLKARASAWSFRLMQEHKVSSSAYFITLTYDTKYVPVTYNGYQSIAKRDLQLFFKRLRKGSEVYKDLPIKYYAVGEYGGRFKRPHYHIIMFNARLELLQGAWGSGHIHYGNVTDASVGYTLKYISKPYRNFRINDDRERPFSVMSKGIGLSYLKSESMLNWHRADLENRMYCNLPGGKKCTMPRYYKERIYYKEEREAIAKARKDKFVEDLLRDILMFSKEERDYKFDQEEQNVKAAFRVQHDSMMYC